MVSARSARGESESPPRAAILKPTVSKDAPAGIGGGVERVLRADLDRLGLVELVGTPALGVSDLELAVGCGGNPAACLRPIAVQLEVDILVSTQIDRSGSDLVLTASVFDRRKNAEPKLGMRRAGGERAEAELLDSIDGLIRELFALSPSVAESGPKPLTAALTATASVEPKKEGSVSLAYYAGGTGAALLLTGAVVGLMAYRTKDDYAAASSASRAQVDQAIAIRDRAEGQATAANILFIAGAAVAVTAVVIYFVESRSSE